MSEKLPRQPQDISKEFPSAKPSSENRIEGVAPIDVHAHFFPESMSNHLVEKGVAFVEFDEKEGCNCLKKRHTEFKRPVGPNYTDIELRKKDMNHFGIQMQVLSPTPIHFSYDIDPKTATEVCQHVNESISKVVKNNQDRFAGMGIVPMQDTKAAIKEIKRMKNELGIDGIEIGTQITLDMNDRKNKEFSLDKERFGPIFEEAERQGMPIFVHPWYMWNQSDNDNYWDPWINEMPAMEASAIYRLALGGVFDKYPNLQWLFAHGGGNFIDNLPRAMHALSCRPDKNKNDINLLSSLGRFYVDTLTCSRERIQNLIDKIGDDKLCLGSDYPFPLGEMPSDGIPGLYPGKMVDNSWGPNGRSEKILEKNALDFLGWSQDYYDNRIGRINSQK